MTRLKFCALSDRGIRAINNDAFCAEKIGKYYVFGVAEGLTDPATGGTASVLAISSLRETAKDPHSPAEILDLAVRESDARIRSENGKTPESGRNITHLSACIVDDDLDCTILDTGEGNAYLISSEGPILPREYILSRQSGGSENPTENADRDKNRAVMISHALGEPRILTKNDIVTLNLAGKFLLMSSGGLHDVVKKERIAEIVLENGENVDASCEFLLEEALSAGSEQTITLVLVHGHLHGKK